MPAAPAATSVDLMFLLAQASHALATELTAGLAEVGITPRAHCVLKAALPGDRTQSQIADSCALDKTTMAVTVDELAGAGRDWRRARAAGPPRGQARGHRPPGPNHRRAPGGPRRGAGGHRHRRAGLRRRAGG